MKFLIDESVEKPVVDWLRDQKYDVIYVAESSPAITDEEVIKFANCESRILITNDKDFGRPYKRIGKSTLRMSKDEYERLILEKHKDKLYFDSQICKEAIFNPLL